MDWRCPLKIPTLKFYLWEVIGLDKFRRMNGTSDLKRVRREKTPLALLSTMCNYKIAVCNPEESPHQTPTMLAGTLTLDNQSPEP